MRRQWDDLPNVPTDWDENGYPVITFKQFIEAQGLSQRELQAWQESLGIVQSLRDQQFQVWHFWITLADMWFERDEDHVQLRARYNFSNGQVEFEQRDRDMAWEFTRPTVKTTLSFLEHVHPFGQRIDG